MQAQLHSRSMLVFKVFEGNFCFRFCTFICIQTFCGAQVDHRAVSSDRPPSCSHSWETSTGFQKPQILGIPQSDVNATFFDPDGHWMEHVSMSLVVPNQITPWDYVTWHNVFVLTSSFSCPVESFSKSLRVTHGFMFITQSLSRSHVDLSRSLTEKMVLCPTGHVSTTEQRNHNERSSIHSYCRQPIGETHRFLGF